jgi:alpha-tubulin suppressor-like RCC1 family protein
MKRTRVLRTLAAATLVIALGAVTAGPALADPLSGTGGTVEHWGAFIGDGSQTDENLSPVPVNLPEPIAQISSSNDAQYALLTNGTVWAWGQGGDGELGDGGTVNSFTTAVQVQFPAGVQIAFMPTDVMPYDSAFAVDTEGNVWGWGLNQGSEFCTGSATESLTPVKLPLSDVTALAGAADHATYDASGNLYSCGTNQYGELGDGTLESSTTPVPVSVITCSSVVSLVASFGDTGAVLANGAYYDWGYDAQGQLGDGVTGQNSDVPVQVSLPAPVSQAAQGGSAAGNGQTLVMLSDGSVYAWGDDSSYQLGDGGTANQDSPELISPPAGVTYQALATGGTTSYAIATTGDVWAWGGNAVGQVGDGTTATAETPVQVASGATLISSTSTDVVIALAAPARPVAQTARRASPAAAVASPAVDVNTGWAGYDAELTAACGTTFTSVTGRWTQPAITCPTPAKGAPTPTLETDFWVGLDGAPSSTNKTVEQTGVEVQCVWNDATGAYTTQYRAWYEMAPLKPVYDKAGFDKLKPQAGTSITATVTFTKGAADPYKLALTVKSATGSTDASTNQACPAGSTCQNLSAEWITEKVKAYNLASFAPWNLVKGYATTTAKAAAQSVAALNSIQDDLKNGQNVAYTCDLDQATFTVQQTACGT